MLKIKRYIRNWENFSRIKPLCFENAENKKICTELRGDDLTFKSALNLFWNATQRKEGSFEFQIGHIITFLTYCNIDNWKNLILGFYNYNRTALMSFQHCHRGGGEGGRLNDIRILQQNNSNELPALLTEEAGNCWINVEEEQTFSCLQRRM